MVEAKDSKQVATEMVEVFWKSVFNCGHWHCWFDFSFILRKTLSHVNRSIYITFTYYESHTNYYRKFINRLAAMFLCWKWHLTLFRQDLGICLQHMALLAEFRTEDSSLQVLSLLWLQKDKQFLHPVNSCGTRGRINEWALFLFPPEMVTACSPDRRKLHFWTFFWGFWSLKNSPLERC